MIFKRFTGSQQMRVGHPYEYLQLSCETFAIPLQQK